AGWQPGLVGAATIEAGPHAYGGAALAGPAALITSGVPTYPSLLVDHGVVSALSAVIGGNGHPFGLLTACSTNAAAFAHEDGQFLQSVANLLTAAVRRCRAETELRESEERLRLALELTRMGTWDADLERGTRTWSKSLADITGVTVAVEPDYDLFSALLHPDDR